MDHKKDIGDLIEDRLRNQSSVPSEDVWGKINHSLDANEQNKVLPAWIKYVGIATLIFMGVGLYYMIETSLDKESTVTTKKVSTDERRTLVEAEKKQETSHQKNTTIDDLQPKTSEAANKINNTSNESKTKSIASEKSLVGNTIKTNSKNNESKDSIQEDGYKVTTTYTYYIPNLDTTLISQSKEEMDRMVQELKQSTRDKDSVTINQK